MSQPIIRGIQAVGAIEVQYTYNSSGNIMSIPTGAIKGLKNNNIELKGVRVGGFRLDTEFVRANPQIASSFVIPLLGGGGLALTNNNRAGSLNFNASRVGSPDVNADGKMASSTDGTGIGITEWDGSPSKVPMYDLITLAQWQVAAYGGDSVGSDIVFKFDFNGKGTTVNFHACTVASVTPLALCGNDAPNYNVVFNYLNWSIEYSDTTVSATPTTPAVAP